jgi:hypothetical protein
VDGLAEQRKRGLGQRLGERFRGVGEALQHTAAVLLALALYKNK